MFDKKKKKKQSGEGKHLSGKSSGLGSLLKPKKKPARKKYQKPERDYSPEFDPAFSGIELGDELDFTFPEPKQPNTPAGVTSEEFSWEVAGAETEKPAEVPEDEFPELTQPEPETNNEQDNLTLDDDFPMADEGEKQPEPTLDDDFPMADEAEKQPEPAPDEDFQMADKGEKQPEPTLDEDFPIADEGEKQPEPTLDEDFPVADEGEKQPEPTPDDNFPMAEEAEKQPEPTPDEDFTAADIADDVTAEDSVAVIISENSENDDMPAEDSENVSIVPPATPFADDEDDDFLPPKTAEKSVKSPKRKKKSKPLMERTWMKVLIAVATTAVVFGICLLISNKLTPIDEYAELAQEETMAAPSSSVAPQEATPTPSPTPEPTPTPTEEPAASPAPTDSAYLTSDTLATPSILPETENCGQLLLLDTVGSTGSLMYYEKDASGWHLLMTCGATLGKNGVSNNKKEGDNTTPAGEYPLLFVYGISKPITQMPFQKLTANSVWVDDSRSKFYNTLQNSGNPDRDWSSCEAVYDRYFSGGTHKACIFIGYNGDGLTPGTATAGKGSMITLCGKTDSLSPTAGCIDIFNTDMTKLLQYLNPEHNPVIIID